MPITIITLDLPHWLILWLLNSDHNLALLDDFNFEFRALLGQMIQEEASRNDLAIQFPEDSSDFDSESQSDEDDNDIDEDLGFYEGPQQSGDDHSSGSGESDGDEDPFAFVNEDFDRQVPLRREGGDEEEEDEDHPRPRLFRPWEDD